MKLHIREVKEHATISIKMLKPLNSVYCIICHYFYLILRSFSNRLRIITKPLWRLTFWTYHLRGGYDVTRPPPPASRAVKTKQTPPSKAQNNHAFYRAYLHEFLVNWATMAVPIVNKN